MGRVNRSEGAIQIAFPAVLGALAILMLYGACVLPSGTWGWVAVAGLAPLAAVASLGVKSGFLCWGGVSILALLLIPDKFCAWLFMLLFGLYPMIKSIAEQKKQIAVRYAIKFAFFNFVLSVLLVTMRVLLLASLPVKITEHIWLLYIMGNVVFAVYDLGLSQLIRFYLMRVDRVVRKGGRFG